MERKPIISVENLSKYYGKSTGVENISFDVQQGEIFGFLGPNGAGKTTTIRILLDLLRPSSGQVKLFKREIRGNSLNIRRKIGYLPGEFSAYGHLTGFEFFALMAHIRHCKFPTDSPLIGRFDLSKRDLQKKIKALSHGTLQKLGIIQALFHKPELLILDEPTTGLDPLMKEVLYDILLQENRHGASIFFSSHNLGEVEKLCHRVAIIRKGKLAGLESIEVLKEKAGQMIEFTLYEDLHDISLPGAELIRQQNNRFTFRLRGKIIPLLKKLADMPVQDVSISEPDLEDLFMQYYRNGKEEKDELL